MLHQQSDEVLFGHFVITLNAAFESKHALEDKGYNSGNKNFNTPTPLRGTSKIHHISSKEHASFDPKPVMPCTRGTREMPCRLVCRCLTFSSSKYDDDDTPMDETPSPHSTPPAQHHTDTFQQSPSKCTLHTYVTLEAEEKDMEEDSKQCHLMMNIGIWMKFLTGLYVFTNMPYHMDYATPMSIYKLQDIIILSEVEDIMTTSSDEDIPPLKDIGY